MGKAKGTRITNTYATGNVTGQNAVGGLVGNSTTSSISTSYATGNITGVASGDSTDSDNIGGLVGYNDGGATIRNSYSTGAVTATTSGLSTGGLVGQNNANNSIINSYATGAVTGGLAGNTGGLVGDNAGVVTDSLWDSDTTTQASAFGTNTTQTATELKSTTATVNAYTQATYSNFDFANDWFMVDGFTRPFLRMEHSTNITNVNQLQLMNMDLSAEYKLANDIDLNSAFSSQNGMWKDTSFTALIGNSSTPFTGKFDGLGNTLSNLTINLSNTDNVGLFGKTDGAVITNLKLVNIDVNGQKKVGGLIGLALDTSISRIFSSGSVTSTVASGDSQAGGLVGYMSQSAGNSKISESYSSVNVEGNGNEVGGLLGYLRNGTLENVYATGTVDGVDRVGGLVGGVLVAGGGTIDKTYATGLVQGTGSDVGGLIGGLYDNYSGANNLNITNSYWDTQTTAKDTSAYGTGLTSSQMKKLNTFSTWGNSIVGDNSLSDVYPQLRWATTGLSNGTSIWVIAPSTEASSATSTNNNEEVNKVVTAIVNTNATKVNVPKITPPVIQPKVRVQTTIAPTIDMGFGEGTKVSLVSKPQEGEPSKVLTLSDIRAMQTQPEQTNNGGDGQTNATPAFQETRVALSDNSIVDLVNGGVNLPEGVDQEFYVVEDKRN